MHRAILKDTNQEVAVKVQHRYVKNHSFGDIYTMEFLVHTVKFFFPQFEFMWLAEVRNKIIIYSQYSWDFRKERFADPPLSKCGTRCICLYLILLYLNIIGNEKEPTIGTKLYS